MQKRLYFIAGCAAVLGAAAAAPAFIVYQVMPNYGEGTRVILSLLISAFNLALTTFLTLSLRHLIYRTLKYPLMRGAIEAFLVATIIVGTMNPLFQTMGMLKIQVPYVIWQGVFAIYLLTKIILGALLLPSMREYKALGVFAIILLFESFVEGTSQALYATWQYIPFFNLTPGSALFTVTGYFRLLLEVLSYVVLALVFFLLGKAQQQRTPPPIATHAR